MKKQKLKVEIEVWNIQVDEDQPRRGYYTFEWSMRINGGKKKFGMDDGSWSSQTKANFKRVLNRGYAAEKVLQNHFY